MNYSVDRTNDVTSRTYTSLQKHFIDETTQIRLTVASVLVQLFDDAMVAWFRMTVASIGGRTPGFAEGPRERKLYLYA